MVEDKRPIGYFVDDRGKVRVIFADGTSRISRTGIPHIVGVPDTIQQPEPYRKTTRRKPAH